MGDPLPHDPAVLGLAVSYSGLSRHLDGDRAGLTMFAYGRAGLSLPRGPGAQYASVRHIPHSKMRRGDLMFFHSGGNIYHAAIFLGRHDGRVWLLHASTPGKPVKRDHNWTSSWYGGTLRRS